MNPLEKLHDIEGLDPISFWPLTLASWLLIFTGIFLLGVILYLIICRIAFKRSWKNDTLSRLSLLEKNLTDANVKESVIALSEFLRRIALKKFSRKECAGLTGEAWLEWLTVRDPKKFDWRSKGALLITVPYAPENMPLPAKEVKELVQAVRSWVS